MYSSMQTQERRYKKARALEAENDLFQETKANALNELEQTELEQASSLAKRYHQFLEAFNARAKPEEKPEEKPEAKPMAKPKKASSSGRKQTKQQKHEAAVAESFKQIEETRSKRHKELVSAIGRAPRGYESEGMPKKNILFPTPASPSTSVGN